MEISAQKTVLKVKDLNTPRDVVWKLQNVVGMSEIGVGGGIMGQAKHTTGLMACGQVGMQSPDNGIYACRKPRSLL